MSGMILLLNQRSKGKKKVNKKNVYISLCALTKV